MKGEVSSGRGGNKEQPVSEQRKAQMGELLQSEEMGDHMEGEMACDGILDRWIPDANSCCKHPSSDGAAAA